MCGPAAPAGLLVGAPAGATLAAAGPGLMATAAIPMAGAASTAALGSVGYMGLGASFASVAPTVSLFSGLTGAASQALEFVSPLGDALGAMSAFGGTDDMRALGQMNAQISIINMNQQLIDAQRDEIERREQAQKELAAVLTGGTQGQSMAALANKIQRDAELDKGFFDTRFGQIGVVGKADTATIQYKTLKEIQSSRDKAFGSLGKAAGKVATAIA